MKKKIILGFALALVFVTESIAQNSKQTNMEAFVSNSKLKWNETQHQFGEIKKGVPVTITFEFTNTGNTDAVLTNVQGSCGCTTTDYTHEAIKPGQKGKITATYNAANTGSFSKTITVTTQDTGNPIILTLVGVVKE